MRPQTLAMWLSAGVPCIAYILTASGYAYWLDSGEFVAAAVQLDIAHPPGHPLSALYGKLLSLLPLGSLSFRVALGQCLATAAASALHCRANAALLRGLRLDARVVWALALFGAWLSALTYALWFQAVRPEVYALQTLCVAAVYERLLHASTVGPAEGHARPLATAALSLGLALTNHHLTALLLLPAFLPLLTRVLRRRQLRSLVAAFGLGALGLSTYVYLPLRALGEPPANLGDPSSWSRFVWVVSARVYAHDMGTDYPQPITGRMLDVVGLWYEDLSWAPLLLACLGLYLGVRLATCRRPLLVCLLVLVTDAFARAWLGPVRANPDILGYLAPSYLALGTLATCCLGAIGWMWRSGHGPSWAAARKGIWLVPLTALALVPKNLSRASLASFTATDVLDELRIRQLPPRAVVVESAPQTVFRALELSAVEGARPDVQHLPLPFLRYPGRVRALSARQPELAPLLHSYLSAHDRLEDPAPLLALARQRPVFVELDTRVSAALYPVLAPYGVYAEVMWDPARAARQRGRALARFQRFVSARLTGQQEEAETSRQLLWLHFMNAVELGTLGQPALARSELERALQLQPHERRLHELGRALDAEVPLDPNRFLDFR